jgi:hypothetical protein
MSKSVNKSLLRFRFASEISQFPWYIRNKAFVEVFKRTNLVHGLIATKVTKLILDSEKKEYKS